MRSCMRWIILLFLLGCTSAISAQVELTDANTCIGTLSHQTHDYSGIADANIAWARPHPGPFSWGYTEPYDGNYDWSLTDEWVESAQNYNVSTLATVYPYAEWDQCKPGCEVSPTDFFAQENALPSSRCSPCDMDRYIIWLEDVVERYDGDGIDDMPGLTKAVKHYEILNEPELNMPELTFFIGTPLEYATILNRSYTAVKRACNDCYVLHAGAAGSDHTLEYWDKVFAYKPSFDISNVHYIGMWDRQTLNTKDWNALLQQHGITAPIWVTEAEVSGSEYNQIRSNLVNTERTFLVWYDETGGFTC